MIPSLSHMRVIGDFVNDDDDDDDDDDDGDDGDGDDIDDEDDDDDLAAISRCSLRKLPVKSMLP